MEQEMEASRADRWVMEQQMQAPKQSGRRRLQISRGSVLPAMWKTQENSAASVENQSRQQSGPVRYVVLLIKASSAVNAEIQEEKLKHGSDNL